MKISPSILSIFVMGTSSFFLSFKLYLSSWYCYFMRIYFILAIVYNFTLSASCTASMASFYFLYSLSRLNSYIYYLKLEEGVYFSFTSLYFLFWPSETAFLFLGWQVTALFSSTLWSLDYSWIWVTSFDCSRPPWMVEGLSLRLKMGESF
jgi:hypothetical protein